MGEKIIFPKGKLNMENYNDRVKNYDPRFAEKRFEDYARKKGYAFKKLLLNSDENLFESPIPHWGKLGLMVSQPDYFCYNTSKQFYAEIKASNKIKVKDLKKYCAWEAVMCDPKYTQYYICFCFADKMVIKTISQVMELLPQAELRQYHEGNKYYILHNL
jgi:hypothetical protein